MPKRSTKSTQINILQAAHLNKFPWLVHGFSTRLGGFSRAYADTSLNLGFTKDDSKAAVERNRTAFLRKLGAHAARDSRPLVTLRQVHSDIIHHVDSTPPKQLVGDGLTTATPGLLLAIQTADCLPIILIDPKRRAGQGSGRTARPRHSSGRWALLHTDQALERNRTVEATCWMLLKRYGIVFRDVLARETNLPKWRELQMAFRRLEDRGEIRGGRFVDGFLGEQFALPVAVESLRATRKMPPTGEIITLSAADPLNLVGILVPGERVPAISGRTLSFRDGVFVEQPDTHGSQRSSAAD